MAQSWARRLNFWNDQPAPPIFGTRISVSSSSGARAVSRKPSEELGGRDRRAPRSGPSTRKVAPRARASRRQVRRRVAVGDRAADRAAVADLGVADLAGGVGQQRHVGLQHLGDLEVAMAGQGADGDVVAVVADVGQVRAGGRCRSAPTGDARRSFISGSSEWPPARSLASSPCSTEQADRLGGRFGPPVVERCRDHAFPLGTWCAGVVTPAPCGLTGLGCGQDRLDDVVVAGAAAEVALEALADLGLGRIGILLQQRHRRHHHARACSSRTGGRGSRGRPPASDAAGRRRRGPRWW